MLSRVSRCATAVLVGAFFIRSEAAADGPTSTGLYTPPADGFILDPAETPIELTFDNAPLREVQDRLDDARTSDPDSPIILTLTGTFAVTDSPLMLPSRTSVILYGAIEASSDATASSLIAIAGARKVAIAGGVLDGHGIRAETVIHSRLQEVHHAPIERELFVGSNSENVPP